jgi:hypothetical protein
MIQRNGESPNVNRGGRQTGCRQRDAVWKGAHRPNSPDGQMERPHWRASPCASAAAIGARDRPDESNTARSRSISLRVAQTTRGATGTLQVAGIRRGLRQGAEGVEFAVGHERFPSKMASRDGHSPRAASSSAAAKFHRVRG